MKIHKAEPITYIALTSKVKAIKWTGNNIEEVHLIAPDARINPITNEILIDELWIAVGEYVLIDLEGKFHKKPESDFYNEYTIL